MKTIIAWILIAGAAVAGQLDLKDYTKVAERVADDQHKSSTNYVSDAQYVAELEAATKFDELKAAILKKSKSDKDKADKTKEQKEKLK